VEKIKTQAGKVSELIFAADTGATYQKTLILTWKILRETGLLLWLILCLVFVGGEWFWKTSIRLGHKTRNWYEELQTPTVEESKSATEMGQSALNALSSGAETLLYKAKKQLGIDAEPPAPKPAKPVSPPTSEPTPPPVTTTTAAPDQAEIAAAAETAKATEPSESEAGEEPSEEDETSV
jgi:hypothetical protein